MPDGASQSHNPHPRSQHYLTLYARPPGGFGSLVSPAGNMRVRADGWTDRQTVWRRRILLEEGRSTAPALRTRGCGCCGGRGEGGAT